MQEPELEYREMMASGASADLVRCVWHLRGRGEGDAPQPIVSDGCVEIVINLAEPFEQLLEDGRTVRQPLAMVVGPTARPTFVRPTGRIDVLGIRLQPWAAAKVLRHAMTDLRDRIVPLDDVVCGALRELPEQLADGKSLGAQLDRAMCGVADAGAKPIAEISRQAVELIPRAADAQTVRELAHRLGRSVRTIQRVFSDEVGLPPKTLLRIIRVQRSLALALSTNLRWTAIAARAGYHDQSHFVRDFRSHVGCTPTEFKPEVDSLTASFIDATATS
ncbi:MAG: helix-turn-helix domain-containing protein [Gemmatimonadaceae bacterium]